VPPGVASGRQAILLFAAIAASACATNPAPSIPGEATQAIAPTIDVPQPGPPTGAWWALRERYDTPNVLAGFDLGVGLLDGEPPHVLSRHYQDPAVGEAIGPARPRVAGPDGDFVVVAYRDEGRSVVEVTEVATGAARVLAERSKVVWGVAIDARSDTVYIAESTPGASSLELVRVDLGTGDADLVTILEVAVDAGLRLTMHLDRPRTNLVVLACAQVCHLHGVDPASGEHRWDRPSDFEVVAAMDQEGLVLGRSCGLPCPLQLVDPLEGAGRSIGATCEAAAALRVGGRLMVASDTDGTSCELPDPNRLFAYGVDSPTPAFDLILPSGQRLVQETRDNGYALEAGWLPLTPSGGLVELLDDQARLTLLSLSTRESWRP
jgi:hypothetical protein